MADTEIFELVIVAILGLGGAAFWIFVLGDQEDRRKRFLYSVPWLVGMFTTFVVLQSILAPVPDQVRVVAGVLFIPLFLVMPSEPDAALPEWRLLLHSVLFGVLFGGIIALAAG